MDFLNSFAILASCMLANTSGVTVSFTIFILAPLFGLKITSATSSTPEVGNLLMTAFCSKAVVALAASAFSVNFCKNSRPVPDLVKPSSVFAMSSIKFNNSCGFLLKILGVILLICAKTFLTSDIFSGNKISNLPGY